MCVNFQSNWATLTFLAQTFPKMDLGTEDQKTNIGIRIDIVKMRCVPIFRKNGQLWHFQPKFAQNGFWDRNFKNLSPDWESVLPRYHVYQFLVRTDNFDILDPNLPKNEFWGRNFRNLSPDLESALPRFQVYQFSLKMDNFDISGPNSTKKGN